MSNGNRSDVDALRENIEHTRQRISGEIEAIGERLTPAHAREVAREKMVEAKDRAFSNVRHKVVGARDRAISNVREYGGEVPRIVRENPVPTAMVLVGSGMLAWWAIRRSREPVIEVEIEREPILETEAIGGGVYGYGGEIEVEKEGGFGDRARSMSRERMESMKNRLSGTAESMRHRADAMKNRAGELASRGRHGAKQAYGRSQDFYEGNPLALGAVCFFAGIGLGMLLPHTTREDRMLGERRQHLVDRAKHMANEAKDVAIHSAKEGMKAARETAKEDAHERDIIPR